MDENVCRICLQVSEEEEMTSIFESDANNTIISNKIKSCCGVELPIESDGFPTKICSKCKIFLTIAYKLRTICQNSDAYLRRFKAKDSEENDENEEMQLKRETEGLIITYKMNKSMKSESRMKWLGTYSAAPNYWHTTIFKL
ncbi:uncharacterized protein LOC129945412 [Eupeodes corollae]|uniref:uncharacterized protein LOC129945412 n=1 Tax=Eupeodes corollae TaxID=290404 RepID=UPI002493AD0A|nr:uncharacterized protein LOC129945412 [Eupeodes corollae]